MNEVLLIVGMAVVTFAVRYLPLHMLGSFDLPISVTRALRYVAVAVLTAIAVPYMFYRDGVLSISHTNSYLVIGLAAVVIGFRSKNPSVTIIVGMALFVAYRFLLTALPV
jgi:branched-subunit amino acid transport protein